MGLAAPLGLLLGLLAVPLILLYVLKLRRRVVRVSSTLLWRRVLEDARANAPWERLRRHLLLLLQLLALGLLVLAFAAPYRRARAVLTHDTILVLDVSASLGAREPGTDGARMDAALSRARELIAGVDSSRRAALVLAGVEPAVLAPLSDQARPLLRALGTVRATDAPSNVAAALRVALALAQGLPRSEVVLVTDGAFEPSAELSGLLARCRVERVGGAAAENAGIVAAAARTVAGSGDAQEILLGVEGLAATPLPAALVVESMGADGLATGELARESLIVESGQRATRLLRVQAEPGTLLRARLEPSRHDALAADDVAWLVIPERPELDVLLASPHPFLLSKALLALPGVHLDIADSAAAAAGHDLVVLEGAWPSPLPPCPMLAFGAPIEAGARAIDGPRLVSEDERHPALRHAHLLDIQVDAAWTAPVPRGGRSILESEQGSVAVAWNAPGGRALAFHFDLLRTDLPLRVAFPVLVADAVDWLTERSSDPGTWPAGQPRTLPVGEASAARLVGPDGVERTLEVLGGAARIPAASACGPWRLEVEGRPARTLAVSLLSPEETNLAARGLPGDGGAPTIAAEADAQAPAAPGRRPLWPWAVGLALVVLCGEWAVFHRRRE